MTDAAAKRLDDLVASNITAMTYGCWLDLKADLRTILAELAALREANAAMREALQDIAQQRPPNGWKAGDLAREALAGATAEGE